MPYYSGKVYQVSDKLYLLLQKYLNLPADDSEYKHDVSPCMEFVLINSADNLGDIRTMLQAKELPCKVRTTLLS